MKTISSHRILIVGQDGLDNPCWNLELAHTHTLCNGRILLHPQFWALWDTSLCVGQSLLWNWGWGFCTSSMGRGLYPVCDTSPTCVDNYTLCNILGCLLLMPFCLPSLSTENKKKYKTCEYRFHITRKSIAMYAQNWTGSPFIVQPKSRTCNGGCNSSTWLSMERKDPILLPYMYLYLKR